LPVTNQGGFKKMIRKIGLSAVALATLASNVSAKTYSQEDMDKVLERLDRLEKALSSQQADTTAKFDEIQASTDEAIDELHGRADENEFQATMNRIKWGAELEVSDNFISGKTGSMSDVPGATGDRYSYANQWTTKLRLNMDATINEKTKFTGRLSMYKNWADSISAAQGMTQVNPNTGMGGTTTNVQTTPDAAQGRKPAATSGIFVERAYVDYSPVDFFTITLGRQPSSDGPGMTLIENTQRKATYPSLLFDGAADGVVMSAKLDKNSKMNPTIRAAYGKGFQKPLGYTPYDVNGQDYEIKDLNVYGAFFEMSVPAPKLGDNLVVLSYVRATDFVGHPLNVTAPNNENLGNMSLAGIYFENNKFLGSGLNYFASFGWSMPESNHKTVDFQNGMGNLEMIDDNGWAMHLGARYDFDFGLKLGYEYNQGSQNWFSFTSGSSDPLNKLATRGRVNDMYAIYQIDMYQFLRMGYTMIDYDYGFSGYHVTSMNVNGEYEPYKTNDYINRFYFLYNLRF
jgi:hypothetical protein